MPSHKKKRKSKGNGSKRNPNTMKPMIPFDDDSEGSGTAVSHDFFFEDFVKADFIDEYDLFRHFFRCLKKTGYLLNIVDGIYELSDREPDKLYEHVYTNYSSDPKYTPLKFFDNDSFFNISEKVSIKFNKLGKRYAEANSKIACGEVLSMEKAIILTNKPNTSNDKYNAYRCHHCLRIISCFVTCEYCDIVIFCSYSCRYSSWHEYHVWECYGLQRNFWSISSFEYVAMRLLFLGAKFEFDTGDREFDETYNRDPNIHGDYNNVYKYVHKFTYNLKDKSKSELSNVLLKCAGILVYLIECTHFFTWFSKLPKYNHMKPYDMYMYIGGLLLRHYGQAEMHHIFYDQMVILSVLFFDRVDFLSAGIFMSTIIFNSTCKPNAVFCIRDNFVVIKAIESIEPGQKINVKWHTCQDLCTCEHCLRIVELNGFVCVNCKGVVLPETDTDKFKYRSFDYEDVFKNIRNPNSALKCKHCKSEYNVGLYENFNNVGQYYISNFKRTRRFQFLQKAIGEFKFVFQPTHIFNTYLYVMALEFHISNRQTNNPDEFADFLTKYLIVVELHFGKYSKSLLCGRCSILLQILNMYNGLSCPPAITKVCRNLLQSVKLLGEFHCISYKMDVLEMMIETNYMTLE